MKTVKQSIQTCHCGLAPQSHPILVGTQGLCVRRGKQPSQYAPQQSQRGGHTSRASLQAILCTLLFLLLAACQQETLQGGNGTLQLGDLRVQPALQLSVNTKAVDSDLYIVIQKGQEKAEYAPGNAPASVTLAEGSYTLEAYNAAYKQTEVTGPVYYLTYPFTITAGEINRVDATVPMINVGVKLSANLPTQFSNYALQVTQNGVTKTITGEQVVYCTTEHPITYKLTAQNAAGEIVQTEEGTLASPQAGTIYEIHYAIETKGAAQLWIEKIY